MTDDKRIHLLQTIPFFGAINDDSVALLLELSENVELKTGEIFFRQNDEADSLYILEHGRASIYRAHNNKDYPIREIEDGACFGDMALIDLFARGASVRAETDCKAIKIPSSALRCLYEHDKEQYLIIQMNMAREMSRRLRESYDLLFNLQLEKSDSKPS